MIVPTSDLEEIPQQKILFTKHEASMKEQSLRRLEELIKSHSLAPTPFYNIACYSITEKVYAIRIRECCQVIKKVSVLP